MGFIHRWHLGAPLPDGLVARAHVHPDSLANCREEVGEIGTIDGTIIREKETVAASVVEQRGQSFTSSPT